MTTLAVPVRSPAGEVAAALNGGTKAGRTTNDELASRFPPMLRRCVGEIGPYIP